MGAAFNYLRGVTLEERFWSKVDKRSDGECWEWQASLDTQGYGNFGLPRNDGTGRYLTQRAHRVAWLLMRGPVERHEFLCHHCDNRKCVNPSHLFVGDHQSNMDDCVAKGRLGDRRGESNSRAKLGPEDVLAIRQSALPLHELATLYGVGRSAVWSARNAKSWAHL